MKRNIIHTLWAVAVLLAACAQEELPLCNTSDALRLSITIADGGYSADGLQKAATRAAENGYNTTFTAGDACGLYIVRDGEIVYDNIKLTATAGTEGSLDWTPEAGTTLAGGLAGELAGERYFLYYPYQEDMTGKVTATATSDAAFFATLISGWQPKADQSDYAQGYALSDLMTAEGVAGSVTDGALPLTFGMKHRMALAVIELPKVVYNFSNSSKISDYTVPVTADFGANKPCFTSDGLCRYLVNPLSSQAPTLRGTYSGGTKEFTFTPSGIAAGTYKTYKVAGGIKKVTHFLQVGDFLLKDGMLVSRANELSAVEKAQCVGVVFHVGHNADDSSDYSQSGIGQTEVHGYVVALQDATSDPCVWGDTKALKLYPSDAGMDANMNKPEIDWGGYNYTQTIISHVGGVDELKPDVNEGYPATYYAVVDYSNNVVSAPINSSGWFLPSIGQLNLICKKHKSLFSKIGTTLKVAYYSSSSERSGYSGVCFLSMNVTDQTSGLSVASRYISSDTGLVRSILAF